MNPLYYLFTWIPGQATWLAEVSNPASPGAWMTLDQVTSLMQTVLSMAPSAQFGAYVYDGRSATWQIMSTTAATAKKPVGATRPIKLALHGLAAGEPTADTKYVATLPAATAMPPATLPPPPLLQAKLPSLEAQAAAAEPSPVPVVPPAAVVPPPHQVIYPKYEPYP